MRLDVAADPCCSGRSAACLATPGGTVAWPPHHRRPHRTAPPPRRALLSPVAASHASLARAEGWVLAPRSRHAGGAHGSSLACASYSGNGAGPAGPLRDYAAGSGNGANGASGAVPAAELSGASDIAAAREVLEAKLQQPEVPNALWWAAIKPPMYAVAYVPISVGAALAYHATGTFFLGRFAQLCVASTCIIAWLNTSNDAFDAATGVDEGHHKPESLVNITGNRGGVLAVAFAFLVAGLALLARACAPVGDPRVNALLGAAVAAGYLYQGPPFRLSYAGLGEPLCFAAFGPLATTAFFLAQLPAALAGAPVPQLVWQVAGIVGATTTAILFCSHFHQIAGDTAAGKRSPLVRLGDQTAAEVLRLSVLGLYCYAGWLYYTGALPMPVAALLALTLPRALRLVWYAHEHHWSPRRVKPLKFYAIVWHNAVGSALVGGLVLARWLAHGMPVLW